MTMFLATCLLGLCIFHTGWGFDAIVDTTSGMSSLTSSQITWHQALVTPARGKCNSRGVLKIDFGAPGTKDRKEKVRIDMWFDNPRRWVFNIGDSSTNNGYSGDSGTTSRDAEIQGLSSTFAVYGNDLMPKPKRLAIRRNIFQERLSVIIGDGIVVWNNWGAEFNYVLNAEFLFALSGQKDEEAANRGNKPNYDIYFGINRVINPSSRTGSGLCWATVEWLN